MNVPGQIVLVGHGGSADYRRQDLIEHTVGELVSQRVLAQVQGYEDLNDHDTLRDDPLLALASGKRDLVGAERVRRRDRGHALAGKSTLNRLERTPAEPHARYHKIVYDGAAIASVFVDHFLDAHATPPERIVLDLDATDDPLHGQQEGRFFHGYYRHYCYLPLYIFCGRAEPLAVGVGERRKRGSHAEAKPEETARVLLRVVAAGADRRRKMLPEPAL